MKTIICPTDSSAISFYATQYADALSRKLHAHLVLFEQPVESHHIQSSMHVATAAQSVFESQYSLELMAVQEESVMHKLNTHAIASIARQEQADIIVMGVEKEFSFFEPTEDSYIQLLQQASSPLLLIPEGTTFKPLKKIAVIIDHEVKIDHRVHLLTELAQQNQAHIFFHQSNIEGPLNRGYEFLNSVKDLYFAFPYPNTSFHLEADGSISDFITDTQADLVVVFPDLTGKLPYTDADTILSPHINFYTDRTFTTPVLLIDSLPIKPVEPLMYYYG